MKKLELAMENLVFDLDDSSSSSQPPGIQLGKFYKNSLNFYYIYFNEFNK